MSGLKGCGVNHSLRVWQYSMLCLLLILGCILYSDRYKTEDQPICTSDLVMPVDGRSCCIVYNSELDWTVFNYMQLAALRRRMELGELDRL